MARGGVKEGRFGGKTEDGVGRGGLGWDRLNGSHRGVIEGRECKGEWFGGKTEDEEDA